MKNRKSKLLIILFLFISIGVQSQVLIALLLGDKLNTGKIEFGLDGGYNFSSISKLETNNWNNSFNLGFYFDFKLKDQWLFNTGVLVKSSLGAGKLTEADLNFLQATIYDSEGGEYEQKISYFLVPALIKYKFKNNMHVELGPEFGLMYKAWIEYNFEEDGYSSRIKQGNKDDINRMEVGLAAGAGYRLVKGLGWTIGVRYHYGFTNVYKNRSGTKNNALFLKLNVPIGVSDEKKKEVKELKAKLKQEKEAEKANKNNKKEDKK
jgi:hypothetical protein